LSAAAPSVDDAQARQIGAFVRDADALLIISGTFDADGMGRRPRRSTWSATAHAVGALSGVHRSLRRRAPAYAKSAGCAESDAIASTSPNLQRSAGRRPDDSSLMRHARETHAVVALTGTVARNYRTARRSSRARTHPLMARVTALGWRGLRAERGVSLASKAIRSSRPAAALLCFGVAGGIRGVPRDRPGIFRLPCSTRSMRSTRIL